MALRHRVGFACFLFGQFCGALTGSGKLYTIAMALLSVASFAGAKPVRIAGRECELTIVEMSSQTLRVTFVPVGRPVGSDDVLATREWPEASLRTRHLDGERSLSLESLRVTVRSSPLRIGIDTPDGGTVQRLVIDEKSGAVGFRLGEGPLFGLGSGGPQFDRRGAFYPMRSDGNPADKPVHGFRMPVPFLLSAGGWAMFLHRPYGTLDLHGESGIWAPRSAKDTLPLDLFVIHAESPAILMREYTDLTGCPVMPPKWTMGYFQSHRTLGGPREILDVAETFRRKRLPCDGLIYLGTGYCPTGWNTGHDSFTFNPKTFDKPAEIIDQLHERHFRVVLHITYPSKGLHGRIPPMSESATGSDHVASYWARHRPVFTHGVDGWWPDTGQDLSVRARLARHRMYYQGQLADRPDVRPFSVYENAGYSGMQRYGGWTRTGDTTSGWEALKEQVPVIVHGSLSGIPYLGSCTGGFFPTPELTGELYTRWFQFSAFTPFFQSHGRTWHTRLPWGWNTGELGPLEGKGRGEPRVSELHNPEVEPVCRKYLNLRYRLIPYLYTLAREAHNTGMPILRAMWLHYTTDRKAIECGDQYLWGRDILVAPVTEKGATRRNVYLPPGKWYDFWTNAELRGGREIARSVDLATMPLYVRAGAILPFDPVRQYTGQSVDAPTTIRIYSGADGKFVLYEDDGISLDYTRSRNVTWTRFRWKDSVGGLSIEPDPRSSAWPKPRRYRLLLLPGNRARTVRFSGEPAEVQFGD